MRKTFKEIAKEMRKSGFISIPEDGVDGHGFEDYLIKARVENCLEDCHVYSVSNVRWQNNIPLCIHCDTDLDNTWDYCPTCGDELIWKD